MGAGMERAWLASGVHGQREKGGVVVRLRKRGEPAYTWAQ
jgi:hypothetical protein